MHPQDPYQQQPYPPQYPPQQPPPAVFVQRPSNKAATVGIWVIVAWVVGPFLLLVLCCGGCLVTGAFSSFTSGVTDGVSSTPSP